MRKQNIIDSSSSGTTYYGKGYDSSRLTSDQGSNRLTSEEIDQKLSVIQKSAEDVGRKLEAVVGKKDQRITLERELMPDGTMSPKLKALGVTSLPVGMSRSRNAGGGRGTSTQAAYNFQAPILSPNVASNQSEIIETFAQAPENLIKELRELSAVSTGGPLRREDVTSKINEIEGKKINEKLENEKVDITLPERPFTRGKVHPVSQTIDEISSIFSEIGFSVEEGPDVENEYNNFTALNTPDNHPARDMHDTFYLDENKEVLLRTHTSPVQIRTMLKDKPPFKIIAPGRTYRSDSDQTHAPMFHQVEGLHIDTNINMGHLKGCLNYFIKEFFEVEKIKMRFRPSHFPFTEPSAEVDIGYEIKDGKIIIGEGDKWLEILGCGMVHPNVLKNVKVDPSKYQGYAFGIGIDRLAMLKYGINDLRAFFDCDYRWLNHFGFDPLDVPSNYRGLSR